MAEKFEDMAGDLVRHLVGRGKDGVAIGHVGFDDGDDLGRVAAKIGLADPVMRFEIWIGLRLGGSCVP